MIARLKGKIIHIKPTELILDVHDIGFELTIPFSTYQKIHEDKEVTLFVWTLHKEDQFRLFGFYSETERDLFKILISISGIGPSMAIAILSGMSPEDLMASVKNSNLIAFTKIPGIGKAKGEKLLFELKRLLPKLEMIPMDGNPTPDEKNDALEALVSLGFDEAKARASVNEIMKNSKNLTIEQIIKESLKLLGQ
ncbi:MAG TPA: Holliday junction branch migration protein RuvA [Spirochaetota bacterium]|jgi:Holliday junction DNA helicase RuvA|nr:Holliday junction branch migration protein RuvA [Spirochaetota bacterium]OQA99625.1 MAG: Holliday junction ATP-dependent DNA helicase RuvA [Spirochaetes bacterium ADurb.Bin218]HOK02103.1 Holliday junction branch migration protein RuvA [Spirochaetota bacterium]HOK91750.1 Holliday junction branch migration protein RuvA [Spirochaetota bacterium]HOQ11144.1 Holliday junction branch migration protein RuvA [Spirochaetota bacterium]